MEAVFAYIKPIIYFLIIENLILGMIPDKNFQKLIKMFCGFVLAILVLTPLINVLSGQETIPASIEEIQWKGTLKQYEKLAAEGDAYWNEYAQGEYEKAVFQKMKELTENEGCTLKSCEVVWNQENSGIEKIEAVIFFGKENEGGFYGQEMAQRNEVVFLHIQQKAAEIFGMLPEQIEVLE